MGQWNENDHPRERKTKRFTDKNTGKPGGDADLPDDTTTDAEPVTVERSQRIADLINQPGRLPEGHRLVVDERSRHHDPATGKPLSPRLRHETLNKGLDKWMPTGYAVFEDDGCRLTTNSGYDPFISYKPGMNDEAWADRLTTAIHNNDL